LVAHASYTAPAATAVGGATYAFLTQVSGGFTPYTLQWTFGDGSSGSALPGSTVQHTYSASGTYVATLKVTDAHGASAVATVGPLVVELPLAGSTPMPWWASGWVIGLAAAVGVASAILLAVSLQRIERRREALNWFQELERPKPADLPDRERR
jgi:PKD repeat protein